MFATTRNRVRRMGRVRTGAKWKGLARRVHHLADGLHSPADAPGRIERYTAIDHQEDITAEGLVVELEADGNQRLAKPKRKRNRLEAKLEQARQREVWAGFQLSQAEQRLAAFIRRFPNAPEQLVRFKAARWKFAVAIMLALACDYPLTFVAISYIAPNITPGAGLPPPIAWLLANMALVASVGVSWAIGYLAKAVGHEAAWGFSGLTSDPAHRRRDLAEHSGGATDGALPAVVSDRSRRSHLVAFGLLALVLFALVVGLVILREPALALLGGLSGGSGIGGLAASGASQHTPSGTLLTVGLFIVAAVPLFAVSWLSYRRESPLPRCLAALTDSVTDARKQVVGAATARSALEAKLANVGVKVNVIRAERDANQVLARLVPQLGHEVMVEAAPELFGVVSTEPHGLHWSAEQLTSPLPRWDEAASEWFPVKSNPAAPRPDLPNVAGARYVPPPEVNPEPNGNGPTETAWAGRS